MDKKTAIVALTPARDTAILSKLDEFPAVLANAM